MISLDGTRRPLVVTHIVSGDLWAGAETQAFQLCQALKTAEDIQVNAVVFNPGILFEKLKALDIPVTLVDESRTSSLAIVARIKRHLVFSKSDVVHTHGHKENVLGVAAKIWARAPYSVRTTHGNPETKIPWTRIAKKAYYILDYSVGRYLQDHVVAVSTALEKTEITKFGSKVRKIFNFIDVDTLRNSYQPREAKTTHSEELHIGIIGRLVPVKRVDLFIETLQQLRSSHGIKAIGHIYGDGPLRAELQAHAASLDFGDALIFHGFTDPIYPEITKLDMLLMCSDHEGLPMVLLEAQALQVPIVAHSVGGIPEVLGNGRAGVLVQEHTAASYAQGVLQLLAPERSKSVSEAAYRHLKSHFDVKINTGKYLELYRSLRGTDAQINES